MFRTCKPQIIALAAGMLTVLVASVAESDSGLSYKPLPDSALALVVGLNPGSAFDKIVTCADFNLGTGEVAGYNCAGNTSATCIQCVTSTNSLNKIKTGLGKYQSMPVLVPCKGDKRVGTCDVDPNTQTVYCNYSLTPVVNGCTKDGSDHPEQPIP